MIGLKHRLIFSPGLNKTSTLPMSVVLLAPAIIIVLSPLTLILVPNCLVSVPNFPFTVGIGYFVCFCVEFLFSITVHLLFSS